MSMTTANLQQQTNIDQSIDIVYFLMGVLAILKACVGTASLTHLISDMR
jgi:hypothetical protein